jgi:hypothetical protein
MNVAEDERVVAFESLGESRAGAQLDEPEPDGGSSGGADGGDGELPPDGGDGELPQDGGGNGSEQEPS